MRRLLSASILTLSLAMASSANAGEWFRLNMSSPIHFGAHNVEDGDGAPPDGGVNNNIDIQIDAEVNGRVYGDMTIPVSVSGIDGTYSVTVIGMPSGATWTADTETYCAGSIHWPSATQGTYHPTIEVRDADGALVATSDLEIIVHAPLAASVSQTAYKVEVGGELSIAPDIDDAIGNVQWSSTPSPLPEWLIFDAATGAIDVDTSAKNALADIVLTAVDQGDLTSASTLPFSIKINGVATDYWAATLGGASADYGYDIAVGSDGAVYVAGHTNSTGAGGADLVLAKYTAAGALSWKKTLGGASHDASQGITVGSDDAVYVTGRSASSGAGGYDLVLAKYTAAGALSWKKTLGGTGTDYGQGVAVGSDGAVYVTGHTDSTGAGGSDLMLAKYTAAGALSWKKTLGGTSADYGYGIAVGSDDAVYVTGQTDSTGAGSADLMLAKYTAAGLLSWKKTLGGASADYGYGIAVSSDDAVYVTGQTASTGAGGNDLLVARLPADGGSDMTAGPLVWQDAVPTVGEDARLTDNQNPTGLTDGQNPTRLTDGRNPTGLTEGNAAALTGNTTQFE